jgi:hypothetical protein
MSHNYQLAIDVLRNQLRELYKQKRWYEELTTLQGSELYRRIADLHAMIDEHEHTLRELLKDMKERRAQGGVDGNDF